MHPVSFAAHQTQPKHCLCKNTRLCGGSTCANANYICLICQVPVCNRPDCSVFLPNETLNWKSGHPVSECLLCNTNSKEKANCNSELQDVAMTTQQASSAQSDEDARKRALQISISKETGKRKCLSSQQRVEMINYTKNVN